MAECWPKFEALYCPNWRCHKDWSFWCQLAFNTKYRTPIYVLIRLAELTEYARKAHKCSFAYLHHLFASREVHTDRVGQTA